MKLTGITHALICGACSLTWLTPAEARFLQVDPVGYDDQVNLYAYVGNDPINHTDPTGRYICRGTGPQCAAVREALRRLEQTARSRSLTRAQRNLATTIRGRYGAEGRRNGVVVRFQAPREISRRSTGVAVTDYNPRTRESLVTLPTDYPSLYNNFREEMRGIGRTGTRYESFSAENERGNIIADEGKHAYDQQRLGRQLVPNEWHPPGQDVRSIVSRAFGTPSVQDLREDD